MEDRAGCLSSWPGTVDGVSWRAPWAAEWIVNEVGTAVRVRGVAVDATVAKGDAFAV